MPQLGGITTWITIGDNRLDEIATEIQDDHVSCYVEVPPTQYPLNLYPSNPNFPAPPQPGKHGTVNGPKGPLLPTVDPNEYTINWRLSDTTYSLVVKATFDGGAIEIEKVHPGRGAIPGGKSSIGKIDSIAITDDWSKKRMLKFVKLTGALN